MRRWRRNLTALIVCLGVPAAILVILHLPVTSRQGVNYAVRTIRMPLYIKLMEFFDRDYHYQRLVREITQDRAGDEQKALAIFEWTHRNIKTNIPEDWPIIDDHVWSIIIRGYGVRDQVCDVFATLCNYAGVEAFFTSVYALDEKRGIPLAFVRINRSWTVWDPYRGNYFRNQNGRFAGIEEIRSGEIWFAESIDEKPASEAVDYAIYLSNLPAIKKIGLNRSNVQSPLNRLMFELKSKFR